MRKPTQKIPIERKKEALEQYDFWSGEAGEEQKEVYARSIGLFLIAFSSVEASLDTMLAELINGRSHEPGLRIVKYLNVRTKIDIARDHYKQMIQLTEKGKMKKRIDSEIIFNKLVEISEFRNKVAHANWATLESDGFVRVDIKEGKDGTGIYFESIKMTPGIIRKFIRQCESLENRIDLFVNQEWF